MDSPQDRCKHRQSGVLAGTWRFLVTKIQRQVQYMDRKCPKVAVWVYIFVILLLRGDSKIHGLKQNENWPACAASLWKNNCKPPCWPIVLPFSPPHRSRDWKLWIVSVLSIQFIFHKIHFCQHWNTTEHY